MAKKTTVNRWKEHHEYLVKSALPHEKSKAVIARDEICRMVGWNVATFYRKLSKPTKLAISEKITIANVYDMAIHFLFPEMEKEVV